MLLLFVLVCFGLVLSSKNLLGFIFTEVINMKHYIIIPEADTMSYVSVFDELSGWRSYRSVFWST